MTSIDLAKTPSFRLDGKRALVTGGGRGETADALVLDVTDVEAVRKAVAQAEPFQVLVNNAGMNRPAYLPDVKIEDFDAIFALNVRAAFFMAQAVALHLMEAKLTGSIINISSQMGHVGAARRTVYCASKHAMEGFTKAMAIELAACSRRRLDGGLANSAHSRASGIQHWQRWVPRFRGRRAAEKITH